MEEDVKILEYIAPAFHKRNEKIYIFQWLHSYKVVNLEGEYISQQNISFENAVDIFNENGEWLYSFKTNLFSRHSFYNDGKIYSVSPINPDSYEQFIEVYQIKYMNGQ